MLKDQIRKMLGAGDALELPERSPLPLPTLWLLGRTGAGKSSLVRALTGQAEVGSGFAPCTRTASAYAFPPGAPVLRFLDTRGIDEADYDPAEDLAEAEKGSHAVMIVARLDDPAQGHVAQALRALRRRRPSLPVLMVHTGADLVSDPGAQARARAQTQARMEEAARTPLPDVTLSMPEHGAPEGLEALRHALADLMPELVLLLKRERDWTEEAAAFAELRSVVLWYAGIAAASDTAPGLGAVSVPALQGAMLQALGRRYGLEWTPARIGLFASALGGGALGRYLAGHALRQGAKLVPVYGQTLGAASAAAVSFAATYALGRTGAAWLYRMARDEPFDRQDLRRLYAEAFRSARHVSR